MAGFVIRKGSDEGRQAYITGNRGRYDELIKNPRVRYARNAMSNLKEYASYRMPKVKYPNLSGIAKVSDDVFEQKLKELDNSIMASETALQSMPPLSYTIRYLPGPIDHNTVDTVALIGAAFEEMGKKMSVATEKMTQKLRKTFGSDRLDAQVIDLNKDGKIDAAEYATTILASDMLSDNSTEIKDVNGKITENGHKNLLGFFTLKNSYFPSRFFEYIHEFFALDHAQEEFMKDPNNRVK